MKWTKKLVQRILGSRETICQFKPGEERDKSGKINPNNLELRWELLEVQILVVALAVEVMEVDSLIKLQHNMMIVLLALTVEENSMKLQDKGI